MAAIICLSSNKNSVSLSMPSTNPISKISGDFTNPAMAGFGCLLPGRSGGIVGLKNISAVQAALRKMFAGLAGPTDSRPCMHALHQRYLSWHHQPVYFRSAFYRKQGFGAVTRDNLLATYFP
ncbi:MAG: hypothetical protein GPOALKHO_000156 [Sodalis sp.]|nr:MAG: hypothetical protein GPOALKHO_000156 [Sodalis sp.]